MCGKVTKKEIMSSMKPDTVALSYQVAKITKVNYQQLINDGWQTKWNGEFTNYQKDADTIRYYYNFREKLVTINFSVGTFVKGNNALQMTHEEACGAISDIKEKIKHTLHIPFYPVDMSEIRVSCLAVNADFTFHDYPLSKQHCIAYQDYIRKLGLNNLKAGVYYSGSPDKKHKQYDSDDSAYVQSVVFENGDCRFTIYLKDDEMEEHEKMLDDMVRFAYIRFELELKYDKLHRLHGNRPLHFNEFDDIYSEAKEQLLHLLSELRITEPLQSQNEVLTKLMDSIADTENRNKIQQFIFDLNTYGVDECKNRYSKSTYYGRWAVLNERGIYPFFADDILAGATLVPVPTIDAPSNTSEKCPDFSMKPAIVSKDNTAVIDNSHVVYSLANNNDMSKSNSWLQRIKEKFISFLHSEASGIRLSMALPVSITSGLFAVLFVCPT